MSWASNKQYFSDNGSLIDVYFETMNRESWIDLFSWLSSNESVTSINCYDPIRDVNLEVIPNDISELIGKEGFYCFVSIMINEVLIFLRYYEINELECDLSPIEINGEDKLTSLLSILDEIKKVTNVDSYLVCPENLKEEVFNKNGVFLN